MQRRRPPEVAISAEHDYAHQGNPMGAARCAEWRLRNHDHVVARPVLIDTLAFQCRWRCARAGLRQTRRTSNSLAGRNSLLVCRPDSASSRLTTALMVVSRPVPMFASPVKRPKTAATFAAATSVT